MEMNYTDIAYNFIVCEDGNVYEGRGLKTGAHTAKGNLSLSPNLTSLGIAFLGDFQSEQISVTSINSQKLILENVPNKKALQAFGLLLQKLHFDGTITPPIRIFPRSCVKNGKESISPGFALTEYLKSQTSISDQEITLETTWE